VSGGAASPAEASPVSAVCTVGGLVSGLVGKACSAAQHAGRVISAGKKLLGGHLGSAAKTLAGTASSAAGSKATFALGLAALVAWVTGSAKYVLHATASVIGKTTSPELGSTWFSGTYWSVAGIAAVLTLPFLFAAAIQALVRSDLSLLARAAFGYLPLAMLAVGIAAPLTSLLLAATDQLSALVASAAGHAGTGFFTRSGTSLTGLTLIAASPFLVFFAGLLTVGAALVLWLELLVRAAAVYVIVLMLPLVFAAFVWPARRIWAIRAVELLVALILSKFVIVAVLSLGGAALRATGSGGVTELLAGVALLALGSFAPWALLRLLPISEVASAAAGSLRGEVSAGGRLPFELASGGGTVAHAWAATTANMRREAEQASPPADPPALPAPAGSGGEPPEDALRGDAAPGAPSGDGGAAGAGGAGGASTATHGGAGAALAASQGTDQAGDDSPSSERSPGFCPIWQMPDNSWPVQTLGIEGWTTQPLEDEVAEHQRPSASNGHRPRSLAEHAEIDPRDLEVTAPAHEDHDPTPPPQPPEGGPL
jgi:type IV secretion system protein TrbL